VLGGSTLQLPVVLGQLEGRLDGFTAAGGEENAVEVARGIRGEAVGQLDGGRVRVRPDREEGQLFGLLRGDLGEALAARPLRPSMYFLPVESQMWWPWPLVMIGTPAPVSMTDWRAKCIQRWSLAFCCMTAFSASLYSPGAIAAAGVWVWWWAGTACSEMVMSIVFPSCRTVCGV
jgi:hypothetical protein